jgi:hypothetical protein
MLMRNLAVLFSVLFATACGFNTAPVLDVHSAKVTLPGGVSPSNALTRDAILRALAERTWTVEGEEPNTIVASVTAGGHSATAGITYDDLTYSIKRLESSPGLKYDGYEIHRRYNNWIKNLRTTIDKQLLLASPPSTPTSGGEAVLPPTEPPTGPVTAPPAGEVPAAAEPSAPPAAVDDDKMPPLPPPE